MDTNYPLPLQTVSGVPYNAQIVVRAEDLTEETANTAQVLNLLTAVASTKAYRLTHMKLVTPFKDSSDAAFNANAITVGDGSDADRFLTSTQVNENGTEVPLKFGALTTPYIYASADTIDLTFGSMTAKSLSDLDEGELHLFFQIVE